MTKPGILVALYKGHSLMSRIIKWVSRGDYSHAALVDAQTGETWEAWHNPGHFRKLPTPWTMHSPGTEIDFFEVEGMTAEKAHIIRGICETWATLGVRYDYLGVLRFITRRKRRTPIESELFCSEAAALALEWAGVPIIRADASLVSPVEMGRSMRITPITTRPEWVPPNPT